MKPYAEIAEFSSFYLEDSYVLGITATPGYLRLDLDIVLTTDHPEYNRDHPGEQHCYRRGYLNFQGVTHLLWEGQGIRPASDADGEVDYGNVDSWTIEDGNRHLIVGDFGQISLVARTAEIVLDGAD